MTRALAVIIGAVPLLTMGCASFDEEPTAPPQSVEPPQTAIPKAGGTPTDTKKPSYDQTQCTSGDTWSELSLGVNEKGVPTRVVMKFGGRDATSQWSGELISDVGEIQQLGETEVRLEVAQTMVPIRFERTMGGVARPTETIDVRGITIARLSDESGIVRLETVGKGFTATCEKQEAVAIGGVARKIIALTPQP